MNKKVEKIIDLLSEASILISELTVEVVSQGQLNQLTGGPTDNDLKKIKILSQAIISIGDTEQKFLDFS